MTDKEVPIGEKLLFALLGAATGVPLYRVMGLMRHDAEKRILEGFPQQQSHQFGPVITMMSLFMPEMQAKYFLAGFGMSETLDDVIGRAFAQMNVQPVTVAETGEMNSESDYIRKFSKLVHIDPELPIEEKEKLILPIFTNTIKEQKKNPLQDMAIKRFRSELNLEGENVKLMDAYWIQQWFQYWGEYEANEGLWEGHDRFRTLAKLFRVRDSGTVEKNGHPAFKFDCVEENEPVVLVDGAKAIRDLVPGDMAIAYDWDEKKFVPRKILRIVDKGLLEAYKINLNDGTSFTCTEDHELFQHGFSASGISEFRKRSAAKIFADDALIAMAKNDEKSRFYISTTEIISMISIGKRRMFDITVDINHNFILANSGAIAKNCDDGSLCTNQLLTSFGYAPGFMLISQKPKVESGVHPLHHVFPIVKAKGKMWAVETIKSLPIVPIDYVGTLFTNLKRAVIVDNDGIREYDDWKKNVLVDGIRTGGTAREPTQEERKRRLKEKLEAMKKGGRR